MKRAGLIILGVLVPVAVIAAVLIVVLGSGGRQAEALSEVFQAANNRQNTLSFRYPSGWTPNNIGPGPGDRVGEFFVILSNAESGIDSAAGNVAPARGTITVLLGVNRGVTPDVRQYTAQNLQLIDPTVQVEAPVGFVLANRPASQARLVGGGDPRLQGGAQLIIVELSPRHYATALILHAPGDYENFEPTIQAMLATLLFRAVG